MCVHECFENCVFLRGLAKEYPKMMEVPTVIDQVYILGLVCELTSWSGTPQNYCDSGEKQLCVF